MNTSDDCPGAGECHGCAKWCDRCGDAAAHVCPHREAGCQAHLSRAALCDAVMQARIERDNAGDDYNAIYTKVAVLRKQLEPLERELKSREVILRGRMADLEAALDDLKGYETRNKRT